MSEYSTPLRPTPRSRSRRRALSPGLTPKADKSDGPSSSYSSPYEKIDLNLSEDGYKSKLLEQERIIGDLRRSVQILRDDMQNESGLNTSILIETSNRISTQENRVHRRDIKLLEDELDQAKKQVKQLKNELNIESEKSNNLETTLGRKKADLQEGMSVLKAANLKVEDLEQKLVEKEQSITHMYSEFYNVKIDLKAKVAELEEKCQRYKDLASDEKERNGKLLEEVALLKAALEESREELNKQLALTHAQLESVARNDEKISKSVSECMSAVSKTTSKALTELKALSTQITNSPVVQPVRPSRTSDSQNQLNKYLADKLMDTESRIRQLERDLAFAKDEAEIAKSELKEQKKLLEAIEGDSEKTNKYLHNEISRITMQKANLRCDFLALEREHKRLKAEKGVPDEVNEKLRSLEKERDTLQRQLDEAKKKLEDLENELKTAKDDLDQNAGEKSVAQGLRNELKLLEEKYAFMSKNLITVNDQCEQYRNLKNRAEESRKRAKDEISNYRLKYREMEQKLENQRKVEAELEVLKSESSKLKDKIQYLQEELDEAHTYYREMLAKQAEEISESKQKVMDANMRSSNVAELERCKLQLSQKDTELRAEKRRANDHKAELEKLQSQLSQILRQQDEVNSENTKLRRGMADAIAKLEDYKRDADEAKELMQTLEDEFKAKETKHRLEDQLSDLQDALNEKERLVTYLQSQINVKNVAKASRRSTLLKTVSEISIKDEKTSMKSEVNLTIEREELEELENEKKKLDSMLTEKKKILQQAKESTQPSAPLMPSQREPLGNNNLVSNTHQSDVAIQQKSKSLSNKGMMRHDIPHRWKDLRHFGVFSRKCAICFMGVPTLGKARRCLHCNIVVHAQCSKRVVNTCGLPDQYGVHFLENNTSMADGRMNGWLKVFRDDCPSKTWQSMWAVLDKMKLVFYDNDAIEADLKVAQPNMKINLDSESWTLKTNVVVPSEGGMPGEHNRLTHNIIQLKMNCYSIFLLAPSISAATRWIDMLQKAHTKRMMQMQKPDCLSEQICVMTLQSPNNLAIFSVALIDDLLLLCAQTGLFYSTLNGPRLPIHIQGISSMTAMACMDDINCVAMIIGPSRKLCIAPISTIVKQAKSGNSPAVHPDSIGPFERLNVLLYHREEATNQRYLCVADYTNIYIFKYNSSKDLFSLTQTLTTREPVICMQSGLGGFYYAADSFYFVPLTEQGSIVSRPISQNSGTDYPVAILNTDKDEVLLACQNHGIFCNSSGQDTRNVKIEWEQMPMEFVFTSPYLYIIHYDSIEILQLATRQDRNSESVLSAEREVFSCQNAHIVGKQPNGDVYISISSEDRTELHKFNAINKKGTLSKKRAFSFHDTPKDTVLNQKSKSSSSYQA